MADFAKLFRNSAFVSTHQNQLIKSTGTAQSAGEWGLKHTVKVPFKAIKVSEFDQKLFKRPHIKSGNKMIYNLKRFQEIMPHPTEIREKEINLTATYGFESDELPIKPLAELAPAEWKKWVDYTKAQRETYLEEIKSGTMSELDWKRYLGLDKITELPRPIHPPFYSTRKTNQEILPVKGRILNVAENRSLIVGIAGYTCKLEYRDILPGLQIIKQLQSSRYFTVDREVEYDFYILSVDFDKDGNADIKVSMRKPDGELPKKPTVLKSTMDQYGRRNQLKMESLTQDEAAQAILREFANLSKRH
ncbi:hypothetical protein HDV01_001471 [Terramyces sp. JEL0728]|nr:hypothetical protein HDV01_001471 [Terramyces sp. JEL0728]